MPAIEIAQVEAAARLAAARLGPAVIPEAAVPSGLPGATLGLDPPLVRQLAAYSRTELTPLAHGYLDLLRQDSLSRQRANSLLSVP